LKCIVLTKKVHPLDLLPFGGVEDALHKIVWPPELSIAMNVAGYREALKAAHEVEIAPRFVVRVARNRQHNATWKR